MFDYAVRLEHDADTDAWVVSCRDLPRLNSVGETVDEALLEAVDAAVMALSIEMDERRPIPEASKPQDEEHVISLPVLVVMKAALHNAMIASGTRKADLARALGMKGAQVDRLLDVFHSSRVETIELALRQLNRVVQLSVNKVAA